MAGARAGEAAPRSPAKAEVRQAGNVALLVVMGQGRGRVHLDAASRDRELGEDDLETAFDSAYGATSCLLVGGEPTLWRHLPRALEALVSRGISPGLVSDGFVLADPRLVESLARRGLRRVVVQLHAARAEAHDWITGVPGSARRAIGAVRACREAGLEVEGEVWLTKPGAAHLIETVAVLARLGVRSITVRRLVTSQVEAAGGLGLLPRLAPSARYLAAAARTARQSGVSLQAAGLPPCLVALCRAAGLTAARETWLIPETLRTVRCGPAGPGSLAPCTACAQRIPCAGAPADHLEAFGSLELEVLQARALDGEAA